MTEVSAPATSKLEIQALHVFMRGLRIEAEIGVYPQERGRTQPLVIDVELTLSPRHVGAIGDTVNYESLAKKARALARQGHVDLVETFAERLAAACFTEGVEGVRVRIEKPEALGGAEAAGVEIAFCRGRAEAEQPPGRTV